MRGLVAQFNYFVVYSVLYYYVTVNLSEQFDTCFRGILYLIFKRIFPCYSAQQSKLAIYEACKSAFDVKNIFHGHVNETRENSLFDCYLHFLKILY